MEPFHEPILEHFIFAHFLQFFLLDPIDFQEVEVWNDFSYVEEANPHQYEHLEFR